MVMVQEEDDISGCDSVGWAEGRDYKDGPGLECRDSQQLTPATVKMKVNNTSHYPSTDLITCLLSLLSRLLGSL